VLKSLPFWAENNSNGFWFKGSSANRCHSGCVGHGDQPWGWLWMGSDAWFL